MNMIKIVAATEQKKARGFHALDFEKADEEGDMNFFEDYKKKGLLEDMDYHYAMTKLVFGEYKSYPNWRKNQFKD